MDKFKDQESPTTSHSLKIFLGHLKSEDFKKQILDLYSEKTTAIENPLNKINEIFKNYGFKHKIDINSEDELVFFDAKKNEIKHDQISDGEKMLVTFLNMFFITNNNKKSSIHSPGTTNNLEKAKLILLDEPDCSLDPDLCRIFFDVVYNELHKKHNIQLIIVTHRIDTVALAPVGSLFTIVGNQIEKCTHLQAIHRMSKILGAIINYNQRVYCESGDDVIFYEAIYLALNRFSNEIRHLESFDQHNKIKIIDEEKNLLLEGFSPIFHTAAKKSGEGGGNSMVQKMVERDLSTIDSR